MAGFSTSDVGGQIVRGLNFHTPDFAKRQGISVWAMLAVGLLLAVCLLSAWRQWGLLDLRAQVNALEDRLAEQRMMQERALRRVQAQSPEERKVQALVLAQNAQDRLRPELLRAIEQAWSPRLAIMSLKLEGAGQAANLEMLTADLKEVFAFVARLNTADSGVRAMVLRHSIKSGDPNLATLANVKVEKR